MLPADEFSAAFSAASPNGFPGESHNDQILKAALIPKML
jgi:hypothetical protein